MTMEPNQPQPAIKPSLGLLPLICFCAGFIPVAGVVAFAVAMGLAHMRKAARMALPLFYASGGFMVMHILLLGVVMLQEKQVPSETEEQKLMVRREVYTQLARQKDCVNLKVKLLVLDDPIMADSGEVLWTGQAEGCEGIWEVKATCTDITATNCNISFNP